MLANIPVLDPMGMDPIEFRMSLHLRLATFADNATEHRGSDPNRLEQYENL